MSHTPTPWHLENNGLLHAIESSDGVTIAIFSTEEDARLAFQAVNSRADLVVALQGLLDATKKEECDADCTLANCPWLYAREALRRAKETNG